MGSLLEPFSVHDAIQGRPGRKTDDFGGVWLQSLFLKRFCVTFGGVLGNKNKTLISHGRGSKNHNFTEVRILLLFGSILVVILHQNLPKMALGLAMGRPQWPSAPILGGPETDPKKSIKQGHARAAGRSLWLPLRTKILRLKN